MQGEKMLKNKKTEEYQCLMKCIKQCIKQSNTYVIEVPKGK